MADQRPPTIDPNAAARWSVHAPPRSPWLHEEVARRMDERLEWIRQRPARWADWGAVRGGLGGHRRVAARYAGAAQHVVEPGSALQRAAVAALAPGGWRGLAARVRGGPAGGVAFGEPEAGTVQLVWSNMALHTAADPEALLARWHRALATDGFLMFSCLGPDSVQELRAVYAAEGWPPAGAALVDMHDWGDMLVAAGFAEPVMDMERLVLTYPSAARLVDELRDIGRNLHPQRFAALRGRGFRSRLERAVEVHGARDAALRGCAQ